MHIVTTDVPAKQAGEHINRVLAEHSGDVVCLLSGGSALDIVEHIKPRTKNSECRTTGALHELSAKASVRECRTIFMMGDERGSRDAEINNSLQLVNQYPDHYVSENLILTIPELDENLENFTKRISESFSTEIKNLQNVKIIQVLGIGLDGHTAGIFPLPKDQFSGIYERDLDIAPVYLESLTIDSRASFTPNWILNNADELITYIAGASKKTILESLVNELKELNERPAELIKQHTHSTVYTDQLMDPVPAT